MQKFWETVSSRKLWAAIAACAGIWAAKGKDGMWEIVAIVSAYIASQAAVDVAAKMNPPGASTNLDLSTTKSMSAKEAADVAAKEAANAIVKE